MVRSSGRTFIFGINSNMRYFEFITESVLLLEASKNRYMQMFQSLPDEALASFGYDKFKILNKIKEYISTFQREDRIVWALRFYKYLLLYKMKTAATLNPNILTYIDREMKKILSKTKTDEATMLKYSGTVTSTSFMETIAHYLSLPIPEIQNYKFSAVDAPNNVLVNIFGEYETEWKRTRKQEVSHTDEYDNPTVMIQFSDGSAWFDLEQNYCEIEGNSMGHCGNRPSAIDTHTVLSYRTPVKETDRWVPHMTFILDKEDGTLGEMKGRANEKPANKYHPYIITLLKHPAITGFGPTGYEPEGNFSLDDLPEGQAEELKELKPGFRTLIEQYGISGMTSAIEKTVINKLSDVTPDFPVYDEKNKEFIIEQYEDITQAMEVLEFDVGKYVADIIMGNEFLDYDPETDSYQVSEFFDNLPRINKRIGRYTKNEYDDDIDPSDMEEVTKTLSNNGDDIYHAAISAVSDGYHAGAEQAMAKEFENWLKELSGEYSIRIENKWDEPATLRISEKDAILLVDDEEVLEHIEHEGILAFNMEDLSEPHGGWEGYDERTAADNFLSNLPDNIIGNINIPKYLRKYYS